MPRFYFNLASKDANIPDDSGKELANLNDAYEHARKLIQKILFHVAHEDAEAWKVIVLNDDPRCPDDYPSPSQMRLRFNVEREDNSEK